MILQAIMAVALVAAVAHSLPHASVDAVVPEPDFYETAGAVKAQHIPVPDAVLAEVEYPNAGSAELLATGSAMPTPAHCDMCVHEFADAGGCDAWKSEDWDKVHAAVPDGCYPCADEAEQHCGMDSHSSLVFLARMQAIDNKDMEYPHHDEHHEAVETELLATGSGDMDYPHHDEHHEAVETELLATGSAMELLATGSAMHEFPQHEAVETELLATGSAMFDHHDGAGGSGYHHDEHHDAVETELLATGSAMFDHHDGAGGSGYHHDEMGSAMPTPAHCDMCVHEFADAGGCDAWKSAESKGIASDASKEDWDKVHAAVPAGCYPCADEAEQHCGMDSHSSLVFLARMQAIDNKN